MRDRKLIINVSEAITVRMIVERFLKVGAEQTRIVQLLVERIDIRLGGLDIRLRVQGLTHMARDLAGIAGTIRKAA